MKTEMQRKGQATMEFLATYGWAILAAIFAVGILAYFGVFSKCTYDDTCDKNSDVSIPQEKVLCEKYGMYYYEGNFEDFCLKIINDTIMERYNIIKINDNFYLERI